MFKRTLLLLIIFSFLYGCGYEPLYLKNNDLEKSIKNINLEGEEKINRKIISFLGINEVGNTGIGHTLNLTSKKKIEVISRDEGGNPSVYKFSIVIDILIKDGQKNIKQKEFYVDFIYNNIDNKFNLSQYRKSIEKNLVNELNEKIFIFLKS